MRRAHARARPGALSGWQGGAAWVLGTGTWAALVAGALIAPAVWVGTPDTALVLLTLSVLLGAAVGAVALVAVRLPSVAAVLVGIGYVMGGVALLASLRLPGQMHINWTVVGLCGAVAIAGAVLAFAGTLSVRTTSWRAGLQSALFGALGLGVGGMLLGQSVVLDAVQMHAAPAFQAWLGTALMLAVIGQCALLLVLAWVEARLDARHTSALQAIEQANAQLRQEAGQRAEVTAALAESEERFRQAFDASPVGMSMLGPQRQWLRVNAALCSFLGYTQRDLLARGFEDVTHPQDIAATRAGLSALESGALASFTQEKRYVRADGAVVYGLLHVSVARRDGGQVREFVTQVLDVTARRQAEDARAESEARFRSAFEDVPVGMALVGTDGHFLRVNRALCEFLGYAEPDLLKMGVPAVMSPETAQAGRAAYERVLSGQAHGFALEQQFTRRDGRVVWGKVSASAGVDASGAVRHVIVQVQDIDAQRATQRALDDANATLRARVAEQERDGRAIGLLGEFSQMLQSCQDTAEAQAVITRYGPRLLPDTGAALYLMPASRNYLERTGGWALLDGAPELLDVDECWALRRGQVHAVDPGGAQLRCPHAQHETRATLCVPLAAQNETLGVLYLVAGDRTEIGAPALRAASGFADRLALGLANLRLRESLRMQSVRDPLTGLYNRRFFEESLTRELARAARAQREVTVLMLDVDHFKHFNDTHGHDAGDTVLRAVAAELTARVRASDVLCRYGGEEFVALLPETDVRSGVARAEALRAAVAAMPISGIPGAGAVTLSAGVASYPLHGTDPRVLLRAADQALYAAKGAGRNRVMQAGVGVVS